MLQKIVEEKLFQLKGVIGFFPANSQGDDVKIYQNGFKPRKDFHTLYGLRQQVAKDSEVVEPYFCLSDFVAPVESGINDYIGMFAVSAGFGCDKLCKRFFEIHPNHMIKKIIEHN